MTWPGLGCSEARAATLAISEAGLSRELRVEGCNRDAPDARFMASVARQEEQGFDVNVTSHLLVDTVTGTIDAAVVINNDRDFAYPSHAPENDSQLAWSIPRRGIGQASSPAGRTRGRQSLLVTTVRMLINSGPTVLGRIPVNVATPSVLEGSCLEIVVVRAA